MIPESVEKITNRILFCSNCTSTSATLFEIQKIAPRNHAQNQNKKKLLKIRNSKEQRTQRGSERGQGEDLKEEYQETTLTGADSRSGQARLASPRYGC